jgi:hypothetical protein
LVYHLTCRGGIFQDGVEQITQNEKFHTMKNKAAKYYVKKWGSWIKNNEYHHPILSPVYKKSYKLINPNIQLEQALEPWFNGGEDIIIEVDGNNFNQQDFQIIQQLNDIIKDSGDIGYFELGNLKITINKMDEYQNNLINIKNENIYLLQQT